VRGLIGDFPTTELWWASSGYLVSPCQSVFSGIVDVTASVDDAPFVLRRGVSAVVETFGCLL